MPNINAPMAVPIGEPMPPVIAVPPTTAAVIALELLAEPLPHVGHVDIEHVEHRNDHRRHLRQHVEDDLHAVHRHTHFGGGIRGSPPAARIQLPKRGV